MTMSLNLIFSLAAKFVARSLPLPSGRGRGWKSPSSSDEDALPSLPKPDLLFVDRESFAFLRAFFD